MRKNKIVGAIKNAGRKKIKDSVQIRITVPKDKIQELKEFAKTLITYKEKIEQV